MSYYGSWKLEDNLTFVVNTHNPSNGSAVDADSVPVYHVYEDETATPLITGSMALLNGSNTIGLYSEQITLSAASGFEKGKSYNIYIQGVVASVTGTISHGFQIEAEVDANIISVPVTAGMVTGSVLGNVNGSVNSVVQPVGINTGTFLNALADIVWDEILSGHLAEGSAGHTLFSRMPTGTVLVGDKTGFSLLSPQMFDLIGNITGTLTNVLNVSNPVVAGVVTGSVLGNVNGSVNSITTPVGISTGTFLLALADAVWDEAIAGHLLVGSTGEKLNAAGAAGDPWTTLLPGSYTPGQAGHILASRMPTGTVIVGVNQDKTGYFLASPQSVDIIGNVSGTITNVINLLNPVGLVTGTFIDAIADQVWDEQIAGHLLAGSTGKELSDVPTANDNADALLKRDWTLITGEAARSVLNALRFIRNKFSTTATPGSVTVYKEDDTTAAYTKSLTTDATADPIVEG